MKFSIITVNYNNWEGLARTIQSVITQSYSDYELIIIDGGSNDRSLDLIKQYKDNISYWISEKDDGIYDGMNKGIAQARGTYVNFMNSGDAFYDHDVLKNVDAIIDGSDFIIGKDFNRDPNTGNTFTTILPTRISMATFFMWTLPHQSAFIRRTLFNNSVYDRSLSIVADWYFFMNKIVFEGRSVQLTNLLICDKEQNGISITQTNKVLEERNKVLLEALPPGIYKDYDSLAKLDRSTLSKLLNMLDKEKPCKWIRIFIKVLYRIYINIK